MRPRRFNLARLDAESANFNLIVDAAQAFERPVGEAPGQIAGAIQFRARAKRMRHELFRGQQEASQFFLFDRYAGNIRCDALVARGVRPHANSGRANARMLQQLGETGFRVHLRQVPIGIGRLHPRRPHRQSGLKEWPPRGLALRLKIANQLVERHVAVGQRAQHGVPHLCQIFPETHFAVRMRAQRQEFEEHPHRLLELGTALDVGDAAHQNVVLPRVAMEQRFEARQQKHVQRDAFVPAGGLQRGSHLRR